MASVQIKRAKLDSAFKGHALKDGELGYAKDSGILYIGTNNAVEGNRAVNPPISSVDSADKLTTPHSFSISGDGSSPLIDFDGQQDVQLILELAKSGVTAGSYTKVTVDAKGRVTSATNITIEDLPDNIPNTKISGLGSAATKNTGTTSGTIPILDANGKLVGAIIPDLSGTYLTVGTKINNKALTGGGNITLTSADVGAIPTTDKGKPNGVATLDSDGKVPPAQLPSYVDDVTEGYLFNNVFYKEVGHTTVIPAEGDKIYIDLTENRNITYRWSGTAYVEISSSLALGVTSGTAFAGDKGNEIYNATINGKAVRTNPSLTASDVGADPAGTGLSEANKKVASVAAKDASVVVAGTTTAPTIGVRISAEAGNSITLKTDGVFSTGKIYTAGNGVNVNDTIISAKVVAANGLSVDATGIKMSVGTNAAMGAVRGDGVSVLVASGVASVGDIDCGEIV